MSSRVNAVANPYLKKKPAANASVATVTSSTAQHPADARRPTANKHNETPLKHQHASTPSNPYAASAALSSSSRVVTKSNSVTPTPKKMHSAHAAHKKQAAAKIVQHGHSSAVGGVSANAAKNGREGGAIAKSSAVRVGASAAAVATPSVRPSNATRVPYTSKQTMDKSTTKQPIKQTTSTSLKSQLKSQIAHLHRQKQLHIQHKQLEKERKLREAQLEKMAEEQQKLQAEQRRAALLKAMEEEVKQCLGSLVGRVEQRAEWEGKGVNVQVGDVVEGLVDEVERRESVRVAAVGLARGRNNAQNVHGAVQIPIASGSTQQHQTKAYTYRPPIPNATTLHPYPVPSQSMHLMPPQSVSSHPHASVLPLKQQQLKVQPPKVQQPFTLHPNPITNPHSPYRTTHRLTEGEICIVKKTTLDSFGVTLRWDCRSALVPTEDGVRGSVGSGVANMKSENSMNMTKNTSLDGVNAVTPAQAASNAPIVNGSVNTNPAVATANPKQKQRRQRVNYGTLTVSDATKATFANASKNSHVATTPIPTLRPGDIILSINGRPIGGLTFSEACRVITTTSTVCAETGVIRCVLKVARMAVFASTMTTVLPSYATGQYAIAVPSAIVPIVPRIPFIVSGGKVLSGEFSPTEWTTLVRAVPALSRELFSGMALLPVSQKEVITAIQQKEEFGKCLQQRSAETLVAKMSFEGQRVEAEMKKSAEQYWASKWKIEVNTDAGNENNKLFEEPLTDAKRSALRSLARPLKGCRCGSTSHEFSNDPRCVLYRDVKLFSQDGTVPSTLNVKSSGRKASAKSKNKRSSLEAAYVERFMKLRAETEASREEAEFVLEMEKKQATNMKKAVFVPSTLCTMVLSAVASLMEVDPDAGSSVTLQSDEAKSVPVAKEEESNVNHTTKTTTADEYDSDSDSDDEDMPLNLLLQSQSGSKREPTTYASPDAKRSKPNNPLPSQKKVPSPYFVAEILRHVSQTYGHLFQEPTHSEFAW